jgi:hypothetical protein
MIIYLISRGLGIGFAASGCFTRPHNVVRVSDEEFFGLNLWRQREIKGD